MINEWRIQLCAILIARYQILVEMNDWTVLSTKLQKPEKERDADRRNWVECYSCIIYESLRCPIETLCPHSKVIVLCLLFGSLLNEAMNPEQFLIVSNKPKRNPKHLLATTYLVHS